MDYNARLLNVAKIEHLHFGPNPFNPSIPELSRCHCFSLAGSLHIGPWDSVELLVLLFSPCWLSGNECQRDAYFPQVSVPKAQLPTTPNMSFFVFHKVSEMTGIRLSDPNFLQEVGPWSVTGGGSSLGMTQLEARDMGTMQFYRGSERRIWNVWDLDCWWEFQYGVTYNALGDLTCSENLSGFHNRKFDDNLPDLVSLVTPTRWNHFLW